MKFFVDTADVAEIKDLAASGLLDGVTTNPSLIMKSGRPMLDVIKEICASVPGPVCAETVATDHKQVLEEGRKLAKLAKNELTDIGLKAFLDDWAKTGQSIL
jgi:transaldolase